MSGYHGRPLLVTVRLFKFCRRYIADRFRQSPMFRPVYTIQVGILNLFDRSLRAISVAATVRSILRAVIGERRSELFIHINMYMLPYFNQVSQHHMAQLLDQQYGGYCRQNAKSARLGKHKCVYGNVSRIRIPLSPPDQVTESNGKPSPANPVRLVPGRATG